MPGGLHPPIEVILSWPRPNYIDPETRPITVIVLACVMGPITIGLLLVRLWVRIIQQRSPGWDDWLMLAATIPTITLTVIFPLAGSDPFNKHIWDVDPLPDADKLVRARKYILASECIFCVAAGMIKISILLFYRRLSACAVSKTFRWATWLSIGFIVAYSVALTLAPILGCQPISAFWDRVNAKKLLSGYEYHCFDEGADVFAASVISVVQDFITAMLPTFLYWDLQIPIRQKLALFGIFAVGYGVVALGCVRAYFSWRTFYETYDMTWSTWDLILTSMLELHIGSFCANAPALKVFFKNVFSDKQAMSSKTKTTKGFLVRKNGTYQSTTAFSKPSSGVMGKVSSMFTKSSSSMSRDGYISEPHNSVSVDAHGGVHVQRDIHISHSPRTTPTTSNYNPHASINTTDLIYDQYYEDIELGRYTTGHNSQASSMRSTKIIEGGDLSALPAMPKSPLSPLLRNLLPFTAHARSQTMKELPQLPEAQQVGDESREKCRTRTPVDESSTRPAIRS